LSRRDFIEDDVIKITFVFKKKQVVSFGRFLPNSIKEYPSPSTRNSVHLVQASATHDHVREFTARNLQVILLYLLFALVTIEERLDSELRREAVPRGNGEKVMVVDDERISLKVMRRFRYFNVFNEACQQWGSKPGAEPAVGRRK